ncbi:hypothetical protein V6N13_071789 [Hibiscus sabdariffa]
MLHDDTQEVDDVVRLSRLQDGSASTAYHSLNPGRGSGDANRSDSMEIVSLNDGTISEKASRKVLAGSRSHLALSVADRDSGRKHNGRVRLDGAGLDSLANQTVQNGVHEALPLVEDDLGPLNPPNNHVDALLFKGFNGGAEIAEFRRHFKNFVRSLSTKISVVMEMRIIKNRADVLVHKLGFTNSFRVEAQGFSGGIWLVWNNEVELEYIGDAFGLRFRNLIRGMRSLGCWELHLATWFLIPMTRSVSYELWLELKISLDSGCTSG